MGVGLKYSLNKRKLGHICDRRANNKQPLGLVKPQYTTHEKKTNMTNQKVIQRGIHTTALGVMIIRCFLDF